MASHGAWRRLLRPAAVTLLLASSLIGCGGEESPTQVPEEPSAPTPSPPPQVDQTALNGYWHGAVGVQRIEDVLRVVDLMYSAFMSNGDASGSVACRDGGSVSLVKYDNSRIMTVPGDGANCVVGELTLLPHTSVSSGDMVLGGASGTALVSGRFNLSNFNYRTTRDPYYLTQPVSGFFSFTRNSDTGDLYTTGTATFIRNGHTVQYWQVSMRIGDLGTSQAGRCIIGSSRSSGLPVFNIRCDAAARKIEVAGGADPYTVSGIEVMPSTTPTSRLYTATDVNNQSVVQALPDTDSAVQAAMLNAWQ